MGVKAGRLAALEGISTLALWSLEQITNPTAFQASNLLNGTARLPGVRDWSGSYKAQGGNPLKLPGEYLDFKGLTSPADDELIGANGGTGICFAGRAIIDQVALSWNWQTGEIISHTVNFSADGELTESVDEVVDASEVDAPPSRGNEIVLGDGDNDTDQGSTSGGKLALVSATLTLTNGNIAYVNSETDNWTRRKPGPALDWNAAIVVHNNSGIDLPFVKGDDISVVAPVGDVGSWLLNWGHVVSFTGLTADRTSGAIIQQTINLSMNGLKGGVLGFVKKPNGDQFWPAAD